MKEDQYAYVYRKEPEVTIHHQLSTLENKDMPVHQCLNNSMQNRKPGTEGAKRSILTKSETIYFVKRLFASSTFFKFYFDTQITQTHFTKKIFY